MKFLGLALLLTLLTACGAIAPVTKNAGVTQVEVKTDSKGNIAAIKWIDGKEKKNVSLSFETTKGLKFTYSANDVAAFRGQQLAAQLTAELTKQGVKGAEAVAKAVTSVLLGKALITGAAPVAGALLSPGLPVAPPGN